MQFVNKCHFMKNNFFINPKRVIGRVSLCNRIVYFLKIPMLKIGTWLGFMNIEYSYVHGDKSRVSIGERCSTMNTIFNTNSGYISVGSDTIFGHNCSLLTGTHRFINGVRASLDSNIDLPEVPLYGRDIVIGKGCFIGSGSTIIGPVKIADNVVIGAGSVVTKDIDISCFAAGTPAKIITRY